MDSKFKVGWKAIPRVGTSHNEFTKHIGQEFIITKIEECTSGEEGCGNCHGDPIVEINHEEVHLCGFGIPDSNFIFRPNIFDWDE